MEVVEDDVELRLDVPELGGPGRTEALSPRRAPTRIVFLGSASREG